MKDSTKTLTELSKLIRYHILTMTTEVGSGHPTSSLSAVELMSGLMFNGAFRYDLDNPQNSNNDRLIFSKGHASPLFYTLWAVANHREGHREGGSDIGTTPEELKEYRQFGSRLEGHPTLAFPYTEAATGSLGQGLSVGVGMALYAKWKELPYITYVLLGDSETAEGSVWEAAALAEYYDLSNLVAILDVNRLGQRGETMEGHDIEKHRKKWEGFGWNVVTVENGNSLKEVCAVFEKIRNPKKGFFSRFPANEGKPLIIIARTRKGKGVSFLEDEDGWHGKALSEEELQSALLELGEVDMTVRGSLSRPPTEKAKKPEPTTDTPGSDVIPYKEGDEIATREAYGDALARLAPQFPEMVVLDAEVSNSTRSEKVKESDPGRFFEMFIAEQNMVGAALGFSRRGAKPCVSSFAAFLTRAFDQIRMSQYSGMNALFVGSHAGVSIGYDGASQMGLEDIALFRSLRDSVVLYPSDAMSAQILIEQALLHTGITYIRTTRMKTPVLYSQNKAEKFTIGKCSVLKRSSNDSITVVGAGVTLHSAVDAYKRLSQEGISLRVIDLFSVKPLDVKTLKKAGKETGGIITVEDHYAAGGIGEAVSAALSDTAIPVTSLSVEKEPRSGSPEEVMDHCGISVDAIIKEVRRRLKEK